MRLTYVQREEIRRLRELCSVETLAHWFGVSPSRVYEVLRTTERFASAEAEQQSRQQRRLASAARKQRATRAWHAANKQRRKAYTAEWYAQNRAHEIQKSIEWQRANPEESRKHKLTWQSRHPEKLAAYSNRKRLRKRKAKAERCPLADTSHAFIKATQCAVCYWCGSVDPDWKIQDP